MYNVCECEFIWVNVYAYMNIYVYLHCISEKNHTIVLLAARQVVHTWKIEVSHYVTASKYARVLLRMIRSYVSLLN